MGTFHSDLTGKQFSRLTVLSYANYGRWNCKCECGSETIVRTERLHNGHTRSCGCLHRDSRFKHGQSKTKLHSVWISMRSRCNNLNDQAYHNYGGRGIRCCERWNDFALFIQDMGERPEGLQLDRIDNNGPYSPENCRWALQKRNLNNKRTNRPVTLGDRTQNLAQWAEELGMHNATLTNRLNRGWTVERALTEPVNRKD